MIQTIKIYVDILELTRDTNIYFLNILFVPDSYCIGGILEFLQQTADFIFTQN